MINAKKRVQLHQQKEHVHTAHKTFCNKMVNLDVATTCDSGYKSALTHNCVESCSKEGSYLSDTDDTKCVLSCT